MWIKYLVKRDEQTVVIKFDTSTEKIILGGYGKFFELIEAIKEGEYFDCEWGGNTHSQPNKFRHESHVNSTAFLAGMTNLAEDYDVEKVTSTDRMI